MIRHYEAVGFCRRCAHRIGYRQYGEAAVHTLRFIRRARDLGFSIEQIAELLGLWQNRRRASADVKRSRWPTSTSWSAASTRCRR